MSESDLLKQIAELQARNSELLAENEKFRNMLALPKKETILQEEVQESDIPIRILCRKAGLAI